jgi:hypothetical protein
MDNQILWLLGLTILSLVQALVLVLRLSQGRANKKNNPGKYGERIATLEKGQEELEKNNEKDHRLIRADIKKLFNLFNGIGK